MRDRYLTISVDDGHTTDARTAELLSKHRLPATFYVPATNPERELLAPATLREISDSFEIGAHTYTHCSLDVLSDADASREIRDGKRALEDRIGKPVVAFCYPRGKLNRRTPRLVREAGLCGARTSMFNLSEFPTDPYHVGVSTHARPYARHVQLRHALLHGNFRGARNFLSVHRLARNWARHFAAAVDWVDRHGGVAHLYMHSWEIDAYGDWRKLDDVLAFAASHDHFARVTNGELFRLIRPTAGEVRPRVVAR